MKNYIPFSEEQNKLSDEENALLQEATISIKNVVGKTHLMNGKKTRNFHAKTHAGVLGTFKLDIKDELLSSLNPFPTSDLKVLARFSNAETKIVPDKLALPAYGISLKISDGAGFEANFPMVNFPVFITNSVSDLLKVVITLNDLALKGLENESKILTGLDLIKNVAATMLNTGIFPLGDALKNGFKMKKDFVLNFAYHSIGCYRFGDAVCKFQLVPRKNFKIENPEEITQQDCLKKTFSEEEIVFDFQVQICKDMEKQPINDLLKEWPDDFTTIGQLVFPVQNIITSEDESLEKTDFSPFQNQEKLLPVGRIQQTRLKAYSASFEARS